MVSILPPRLGTRLAGRIVAALAAQPMTGLAARPRRILQKLADSSKEILR